MDMQSTDTPPDVIRFAARDGRALTGTMFHPANTARANVIVHGATAVPRRHYDAFAQHLAGIGYRVFTYDSRGVGDSAEGHARTDGATMTDWFEHDAPAAVKVLVNRGPSLPLLAIGHSFGGQIPACLDGVPKPDAIVTTGAQREHRYEVLKKQAEEKGLAEDVKFYLEFFQYGCPPHGGFGLGIDRLTMLLCGLSIKDAEFLFRGPNRLTP